MRIECPKCRGTGHTCAVRGGPGCGSDLCCSTCDGLLDIEQTSARPPGDFDPDRERAVKDVLNLATGMTPGDFDPDETATEVVERVFRETRTPHDLGHLPRVASVVGLALAPPLPPSTPETLTAADKLAAEIAEKVRTAVLLLLNSAAPALSTTMESRVVEMPLCYVVLARDPVTIGALKALLGDVPEPVEPEVGSRVREASAADLARLEADARRHRHKP